MMDMSESLVNETFSGNESNYIDEENGDEELIMLCDSVGGLDEFTAGFFFVIFLLSVTGNGLLLVAMCRYEDLRRVTNMFILNLLTSDLLFTLTLPFWAVYQLSHWMFGDLACKLLTGAYFTGLYSSMMLLTSMTVYRCVIVVKSRWTAVPRRRLRYAWAACTASWVVSLAASVSDAISSQVQEVENGTFTCEFSLGTTNEKKLGYYLQVSLLFVLPLIIIILCYSAILRTVLVTATRRRHRTVLVVFCIVVAFFVCWAPYNLIIFVLSVYTPVDCGVKERLHVVFIVCRIVAYAHCFLNPALYMLSHSFRRHVWSLLCCPTAEEWGRHGGGGERSVGHSTSHNTPGPTGPAVVLQDPRENNYTATWIELRSELE